MGPDRKIAYAAIALTSVCCSVGACVSASTETMGNCNLGLLSGTDTIYQLSDEGYRGSFETQEIEEHSGMFSRTCSQTTVEGELPKTTVELTYGYDNVILKSAPHGIYVRVTDNQNFIIELGDQHPNLPR